jgi:cytochrome c biogenesis protein CcmG, thiol:disulfide interchange protein DsbE
MWARLSIVAGLVAGVAVAGLVLGAILLLSPTPTPPPVVTPPPVAMATSSIAPSPTAAPSATPAVTPSPASPSATADAPDASPSPSLPTLLHIGQPAPPLVLPKVGGGTIDLASLKGKPVWLDFTSTASPAAQEEFPLMGGFATRYADAGLAVVAVDVGENEATAAAFAQALGTTFPIGLDKDGAAAEAWGAHDLPVHYWIDADGIVRDGAMGGIGSDIMARGVAAILPGVVVQP